MTDQEFIKLLRRNLTLDAEYKPNYGAPYVIINLVVPSDDHNSRVLLGSVRIDCEDLKSLVGD